MTFTALAKIYSIENFCNTKVAGLGEINILSSKNIWLYGIYKVHNVLYTLGKRTRGLWKAKGQRDMMQLTCNES